MCLDCSMNAKRERERERESYLLKRFFKGLNNTGDFLYIYILLEYR
ncbi:MAG: hypothetical protein J8272_00965 ['Prunus persica' phytoplasma PP2]|nr:hypothetical protein ['Prunus persica' phytoplasma PP2]